MKSRKKQLTPEQLSEIRREAVAGRWKGASQDEKNSIGRNLTKQRIEKQKLNEQRIKEEQEAQARLSDSL